MKILKLHPIDAAVYEGIKAGKKPADIAVELDNMNTPSMAGRIGWLVKNGIIQRTGSKRKFIYTAVEISYEIIEESTSAKSTLMDNGPDHLLEEMIALKLSEEQIQFINDNRDTMGRTALAKEIGITKLQLNHVMLGMTGKKKLEMSE